MSGTLTAEQRARAFQAFGEINLSTPARGVGELTAQQAATLVPVLQKHRALFDTLAPVVIASARKAAGPKISAAVDACESIVQLSDAAAELWRLKATPSVVREMDRQPERLGTSIALAMMRVFALAAADDEQRIPPSLN